MRYFVNVGGSELPVDVTALPGGGYDVQLEGKRIDADVMVLPDALSVRIGNRVLDLTVEGKPPRLGAVGGGVRAYVDVQSERQRAAAEATAAGAATGGGSVTSPMPGRVVKVLVKEGAEVDTGDAVVVVEAMKMENELRATRPGVVARILVKEGDRVEGGAVLVEMSG
jgi:biotin carboxyl carrier protein